MENRIKTENTKESSKWLMSWISAEKSIYVYASVSILFSATCFVGFSCFLSKFAAIWLADDIILPYKLYYAFAFMAGRYFFDIFSRC